MVRAEAIKDGGVTTKIEGDSDAIRIELVCVLAAGVIMISDDKDDMEDNFIALVLTAINMLEEKIGVRLNTEHFRKMLDIWSMDNRDEIVEAAKHLTRAMNGEKTDGN